MTRRELLAGSIAAGALSGQQNGRPNILWLLAEDLSPQLGCYGEPLVRTPNLDRMSQDGVRFENAFTTAPVCSASRSAMATGMYQTSIRSHNHRTIFKKPLPSGVRHFCEHLRDAGYYTVLAKGGSKTDYNFVAGNPFDGTDWKDRPAGKPFFAQWTLNESHKMSGGWPRARKLTPRIDPQRIELPPYWPDHPVARDEYANYLEAVQLVDARVGEVFRRLESEGLAENTVVFFLGDNGSCLFRGKQFLYEGGIRVPLLVRWPGKLKGGEVRRELISGIDVTATILTSAGVSLPPNLHGRDFLQSNAKPRDHVIAARDRCDIATERMRCVRDQRYKYIRNFLPSIPYMQRNPYKEEQYATWNLLKQLKSQGKLNAAQLLFTAESKPVEELYDLETDPHEVRNLAGDTGQAPRLKQMRALLDGWMVETGDQGSEMEDPVPIYEDFFAPKPTPPKPIPPKPNQ